MKARTKHISSLIRQSIDGIDPNAEVYLYGSRARGNEQKDSDWDILVLTDYPVDSNKERTFRNKLYDLELDTGEAISIFVYSKKEWNSKQRISPFYQNVTQEGIQL